MSGADRSSQFLLPMIVIQPPNSNRGVTFVKMTTSNPHHANGTKVFKDLPSVSLSLKNCVTHQKGGLPYEWIS